MNVYRTTYAWIGTTSDFRNNPLSDKEMFCAWCKKSRAEIKKIEDPNIHIDNHVKEDKK